VWAASKVVCEHRRERSILEEQSHCFLGWRVLDLSPVVSWGFVGMLPLCMLAAPWEMRLQSCRVHMSLKTRVSLGVFHVSVIKRNSMWVFHVSIIKREIVMIVYGCVEVGVIDFILFKSIWSLAFYVAGGVES
jgi:hypothetical protein